VFECQTREIVFKNSSYINKAARGLCAQLAAQLYKQDDHLKKGVGSADDW